MRDTFDLSLYFVADPACCSGRDVIEVVSAAAEAGVSMVQYRNKSGDMVAVHAQAAALAEILKSYGIPFIVNDYVDVAFAVGADGVHLGQGDTDPRAAREKLGERAVIGQTAFTAEHMAAIDAGVVDYVGTGPFYPTKTDKGKPVLGAMKFTELVGLSPVPVVGIGGVKPENARAVIDAGAQGVAMMRSISEAEDVQKAVQQFQEVLR